MKHLEEIITRDVKQKIADVIGLANDSVSFHIGNSTDVILEIDNNKNLVLLFHFIDDDMYVYQVLNVDGWASWKEDSLVRICYISKINKGILMGWKYNKIRYRGDQIYSCTSHISNKEYVSRFLNNITFTVEDNSLTTGRYVVISNRLLSENRTIIAFKMETKEVLDVSRFCDAIKDVVRFGDVYLAYAKECSYYPESKSIKMKMELEYLHNTNFNRFADKYKNCVMYPACGFDKVLKHNSEGTYYYLVNFTGTKVKLFHNKYQVKMRDKFVDLVCRPVKKFPDLIDTIFHGLALIKVKQYSEGKPQFYAVEAYAANNFLTNEIDRQKYIEATSYKQSFSDGTSIDETFEYIDNSFEGHFEAHEDYFEESYDVVESTWSYYYDNDELIDDDGGDYEDHSSEDHLYERKRLFEVEQEYLEQEIEVMDTYENEREITRENEGLRKFNKIATYIKKVNRGRYFVINDIADLTFSADYSKDEIQKIKLSELAEDQLLNLSRPKHSQK